MSGYLHRQYHSSNILPRNVFKGKKFAPLLEKFHYILHSEEKSSRMKVNFIMRRTTSAWCSTMCGKYILLLYMRGKDDLCPPIYPVTYPSVGIPCELRLHAFIKQNFGLVLLMLSEAGC